MTAKRKGSRNELKTIRYLEAIGFVCTKSGGSLGLLDIIAIGRDLILGVQVKSNRWPGSVEMENLETFARSYPLVTVQVWVWKDYARQPEVRTL